MSLHGDMSRSLILIIVVLVMCSALISLFREGNKRIYSGWACFVAYCECECYAKPTA